MTLITHGKAIAILQSKVQGAKLGTTRIFLTSYHLQVIIKLWNYKYFFY